MSTRYYAIRGREYMLHEMQPEEMNLLTRIVAVNEAIIGLLTCPPVPASMRPESQPTAVERNPSPGWEVEVNIADRKVFGLYSDLKTFVVSDWQTLDRCRDILETALQDVTSHLRSLCSRPTESGPDQSPRESSPDHAGPRS